MRLTRSRYNGDTREPHYVPPVYSGPEPSPAGFDGGKTYHGSCHCGAVTAAVKVKEPLEDGAYKGPIVECNCSICRRVRFPPPSPWPQILAVH